MTSLQCHENVPKKIPRGSEFSIFDWNNRKNSSEIIGCLKYHSEFWLAGYLCAACRSLYVPIAPHQHLARLFQFINIDSDWMALSELEGSYRDSQSEIRINGPKWSSSGSVIPGSFKNSGSSIFSVKNKRFKSEFWFLKILKNKNFRASRGRFKFRLGNSPSGPVQAWEFSSAPKWTAIPRETGRSDH